MASANTGAIERKLDRIRSLGLEELRFEWHQQYHSEPPKISRGLLVLALGYKLQEIEHGGLGKSTRRKLQTIAKALRTTGRVGPTPILNLKPGSRLVREWHGRTHTVTVTDDGFEYAGVSYASLTRVAKKITGAHWSGPRFFGLPAAATERPSNGGRNG
jgi:DUF2924 family protein